MKREGFTQVCTFDTIMLRFILFSSICLHTAAVFSQSALRIQDPVIERSGLITWSTFNEETKIKFIVQEWRWNKWVYLADFDSKGSGDNSYSFLADTSCLVYKVRIATTDTAVHSAATAYPNPPQVQLKQFKTTPTNPVLQFSRKTKFQIYDQYGEKKLHGCDVKADPSKLAKGMYYIFFGDKVQEFKKSY